MDIRTGRIQLVASRSSASQCQPGLALGQEALDQGDDPAAGDSGSDRATPGCNQNTATRPGLARVHQ
jgi:hypothetical protein